MLAIPDNNYSKPEVLASWAELAALADDNGVALHGDMLESLRDSTLYSDASGSEDGADSATAGSPAAVLSETWMALHRRQRLLGDAWPFALTDNSMGRREEKSKLESVAAYATLLLIEAAGSKWYSGLKIAPGDAVRTWFESIVVASASRLLGGLTQRFGAPFSKDWPNTFPERVKHLASLFELEARESDLRKHSKPQQQDDSLDVLARWNLTDEEEGCPYLLFQCATGKNWKTDKPAQPSMDLWNKYISWNGPRYKALAIPFTLRERGELDDASIRHQSAFVFDRIRISFGKPDDGIDNELREKLVLWCGERFAMLRQESS